MKNELSKKGFLDFSGVVQGELYITHEQIVHVYMNFAHLIYSVSMAFPLHIYYIRQVRGSFRARFVNTLWSVLAALWGVMEVSL